MSKALPFPNWILIVAVGVMLAIEVAPKAIPFSPKEAGRPATCRAIDGDTLRCGSERIRLLGIDAAELPGHCREGRDCAPGDPFAQKALLAQLVAKPVTIIPVKQDHWGRTVATVLDAGGNNVSCALISAGVRYVPKWDDGLRTLKACPTVVARQGNPGNTK